MLIFSGLIDMADDPNALAGVLAHELAHISHRHPSQLMVANAGIASVLSLLVGDVSGGTFMATMGKLVVGSAYSREFEREADQSGIEMMRSANFDIAPMIPLMEKLNKLTAGSTESIFALISSHPGGEERLELLRAAGKTGAQAMSPKTWAEVKGMCKE
jgi:predicted Zn-dependent protease